MAGMKPTVSCGGSAHLFDGGSVGGRNTDFNVEAGSVKKSLFDQFAAGDHEVNIHGRNKQNLDGFFHACQVRQQLGGAGGMVAISPAMMPASSLRSRLSVHQEQCHRRPNHKPGQHNRSQECPGVPPMKVPSITASIWAVRIGPYPSERMPECNSAWLG